MARNRERHRLVKEKIRKNKVAIYHYQKEKYDYIEQINRLEQDLQNLTEESELYKERVSDLEYYKRKVRENEQVIERLFLCFVRNDRIAGRCLFPVAATQTRSGTH